MADGQPIDNLDRARQLDAADSQSENSDSMIALANEVWRLENRIQKVAENISDDQKKAIDLSISKIYTFLNTHNIEVKDYTARKYSEGTNVEVLSYSEEGDQPDMIIKTHSPEIRKNGKIIKKAKVIVSE